MPDERLNVRTLGINVALGNILELHNYLPPQKYARWAHGASYMASMAAAGPLGLGPGAPVTHHFCLPEVTHLFRGEVVPCSSSRPKFFDGWEGSHIFDCLHLGEVWVVILWVSGTYNVWMCGCGECG